DPAIDLVRARSLRHAGDLGLELGGKRPRPIIAVYAFVDREQRPVRSWPEHMVVHPGCELEGSAGARRRRRARIAKHFEPPRQLQIAGDGNAAAAGGERLQKVVAEYG